MSIGGVPGITASNIASSVAGSQVRSTDETAAKAAAAQANNLLSADAFAARTLGDVAETEQSADRDADGTADYAAPGRTGTDETSEAESTPAPRADDAFGERGQSLDLDG